MPATNANNSRWFMLREAADFEPRLDRTTGLHDPFGPAFDDAATAFFDDARRVLELRPAAPKFPQFPLPGWADDGLGQVYAADGRTFRPTVRRCDGSLAPFPCDPCVVRCAAGMAIDRRGFVYVADPGQHAVLVIDPATEHLEARLRADGMIEPVDVAVSLDGRVYVADRAGGRVFAFSARFALLGAWDARNADGLPAAPRPVAVLIGEDGHEVLVADAAHPRLLRFSAAGEPLGDVPLAPAETSAAGGAGGTSDEADCNCLPAVAPCPGRGCDGDDPSRPRDLFDAVHNAHRNYRLGRLQLLRAYPASAAWVSAVLDGSRHDTTWHKLEFDADLPAGCAIRVQTATSNRRNDLAAVTEWDPPGTDDDPAPSVDPGAPDLLIHSPPGRFMRLRVTLESDGRGTPSLRALRVLFPRNSYLDALPRVYRATMGPERFLENFLALFEHAMTRFEDRYEDFSRQLDPEAALPGMVDWLGGLLDLAFDVDWPVARRRALLLRANDLYRIKGTPRGIREYVRAYTGLDCQVREDFLGRPGRAAYLGRRGFVLGTTSLLTPASAQRPPDEAMYEAFAHRFSVLVYMRATPECSQRVLGVIERIVSANKPAHTAHRIVPVYPGGALGTVSRVGIDLVLTRRAMPAAAVGACDASSEPASGTTLGQDMVLGDGNPLAPRPRGRRL